MSVELGNLDATTEFLEIMWPMGVPDGERLSITTQTSGFRTAHVRTIEEATATAETLNRQPLHSWLNMATRRPGLAENDRGAVADCLTLACVWLDLDVLEGAQSGAHANPARAFTTWSEVDAFVANLPVAPTATVHTGNGLAVYLAFDEPVPVVDAKPVLGVLEEYARRRSGGRADAVFNVDRMMRLPGTVNVKDPADPRPVTIRPANSRPRYSPDELAEALTLEPEPQHSASPAPLSGATAKRAVATSGVGGRPGDDYNAACTNDDMVDLLTTHGFTELDRVHQDGRPVVRMARPGISDHHAVTVGYAGEGCVHVFSTGIAELDAGTTGHGKTHTPFAVRTALVHGGDFKACAAELRKLGHGGADPAKYFSPDKSVGLLVQTLAADVREVVELARLRVRSDADDDSALWVYEGGVYKPGGTRHVERAVAALLCERLRDSYVKNVTLALRTGDLPELDDGPPHPGHINFTNGMLNWRTLELEPHDPKFRSTVQIGVPWTPTATTTPLYDRWLDDVLDADAHEFLDEVLGYLMLNGNPLHRAFMLRGIGRNGKGTWMRLLKAILGPWNCAAVALQTLSENRFASADLHMKLANIAGDLDHRFLQDTSTFKMVTGGDSIRAERKYSPAFSFVAWSVPVFSANQTPGSADTSAGFLARWEVVNFPRDLTGRTDASIEESIAANELAAIAVRGVHGLRRLMERRNFDRPASVAAAWDAFAADVDQVRAWVLDSAVRDDAWTPRTELHDAYKRWALEADRGTMTSSNFYERLELAGYRAAKRHGIRGFDGIRLRRTDDGDTWGQLGAALLSPNAAAREERVGKLPPAAPTWSGDVNASVEPTLAFIGPEDPW